MSDKVDELVGGRRRLTVVLQGEYSRTEEPFKDSIVAFMKNKLRVYPGDLHLSVIEAQTGQIAEHAGTIQLLQRELARERDLREQADAKLAEHAALFAAFGKVVQRAG